MDVKRILCPMDFSANSEAVLALATAIAKDAGAELHIVHAYEAPSGIVVGGMVAYPTAIDTEEGRKQLARIVPSSPEVRFKHEWIQGEPPTVLVQYARKQEIDLIVMGTHGHTGLNRVLMGSVAEAVVRRAECPVLTIRYPAHEPRLQAEYEGLPVGETWIKNAEQILCPVDFSRTSDVALGLASSLARETGATLHILHVEENPTAYGPGLYETLPSSNEDQTHRLFATRPCGERVVCKHELLRGDPAQEIIAYGREQNADLIVIGSHGRTGLFRLLMGSVAEQIVRKSPVPVLTIKSSRTRSKDAMAVTEHQNE